MATNSEAQRGGANPQDGNPYVGPRTFTEQEARLFFGRDREARDLLALVLRERLTLFYAQSGAGKSSLLNTRLAPTLREQGFDVLPVGRVSGGVPAGVDPGMVKNIFTYNLLLSINQKLPAEHQLPAADLVGMSLLAFLGGEELEQTSAAADASAAVALADLAPTVLLIDQFEEIVTTHLDHWAERRGFFEQIRVALDRLPNLWIVLTMREDYVAPLEPYAEILPNRLRARFYMQRMGVEAALEAIKRPAAEPEFNRPFAPGVAETLVDNLRRIRAQYQDQSHLGQYVEPVQLQVVCFELWRTVAQRPPGPIVEADLPLGYIDEALSNYYVQALADALAAPAVQAANESEQHLRAWFSEELITEGIRNTVLRNEETHRTGTLPNVVVDALSSSYLLRTEPRAGGQWVELVHDRFIDPILESNRAWKETLLQRDPLLRTAYQWDRSGRAPAQLLTGTALQAILQQTSPDRISRDRVLKDFLEACQEKQRELDRAEAQAQRRIARQLRWLTAGLVAFLVLALIFGGISRWQAQRADIETGKAVAAAATAQAAQAEVQSLSLARFSEDMLVDDPDLALALAIQAYDTTISATVALPQAVLHSLLQAAYEAHTVHMFDHGAPVYSVAYDSAQQRALSGGADGTLYRWEWDGADVRKLPLIGHTDTVWSVAISADGQRGLSAGQDGKIVYWDLDTGEALRTLADLDVPVWSVAFNPQDDTQALSGDSTGAVILWNLATGQPIERLTGHTDWVYAVAFSPDGRRALSGSEDQTMILWDLVDGQIVDVYGGPNAENGHHNWVRAVAFNPVEPEQALSASDQVLQWELTTNSTRQSYDTSPGTTVYSISFAPDGTRFASASDELTVWDYATGEARLTLKGHDSRVRAVAYGANGTLLSGGLDGQVRLWDIATGQPAAEYVSQSGVAVPDVAVRAFGARQPPQACNGANYGPIDVGTMVTLGRHRAVDGDEYWAEGMAEYVGRQAVVTALAGTDSVNCPGVYVDVDGARYFWRIRDLTLPGQVRGLTASPDGRFALAGGDDGILTLWDLHSGRQVQHLGDGTSVITVAAFVSDTVAATGDLSGTVTLWDLVSGAPLAHLSGVDANKTEDGLCTPSQMPILDLRMASDGDHLVAVSADSIVRHWSLAGGCAAEFGPVLTADERAGLMDIVISPNLDKLVVAYEAGIAVKEIVTDGAEDVSPPEPISIPIEGGFADLIYSADGARLLALDTVGAIRQWEIGAEHRLDSRTEFREYATSFSEIAAAGPGHYVVVLRDGSLATWNPDAGQAISPVAWESLPVGFAEDGALVLSDAEGTRLTSRNDDGQLTPIDLALLPRNDVGNAIIASVSLEGGQSALAGFYDGAVAAWSLAHGFERVGRYPGAVYAVAAADRMQRIASLHDENVIAVWEPGFGQPLRVLTDTAALVSLDLSPSGRYLAAGGADGGITLWDLDSAEAGQHLAGHSAAVRALVAGDRYTVSGDDDGRVIVWNSKTGMQERRLGSYGVPVQSLAVSPDGQELLVGTADGTMELWDIPTGGAVTTFPQEAAVRGLAFSPDGLRAASIDANHLVRIWRMHAPVRQLRDNLVRYLPPVSCRDWEETYDVRPAPQGCPTPAATVTPAATPTPQELVMGPARLGENVGTLPLRAANIYTYAVKGGDILSVYLHAARPADVVASPDERVERGKLDLELGVQPAGGTAIDVADVQAGVDTDAEVPLIYFANPGEVAITVRSFEHASSGQYTLTVQPAPAIGIGQTITDHIDAGKRDLWVFQGGQGRMVNILMRDAGSGMDTYLELRDIEDRLLSSDDDSGPGSNALIARYVLPEGDAFSIVARAFNDAGSGSYQLTLTEAISQAITAGTVVTGALENPAAWVLAATAGQPFQVNVSDSSGAAGVEVYAPDGSQVTSGRNLLIFPSQTGSYVLRGWISDQTGVYQVAVPQESIGAIAPGQTVTGLLEANNVWRIEGQPPAMARAMLTTATDVSARLQLRSATGAVLQEATSNGSGQVTLNLWSMASGDNYIVPAIDYGTGAYTLTLTELTPQVVSPGQVVTGVLGAGDIWRIASEPGAVLRARLEAAPGALTRLQLVGASGAVLKEDADGSDAQSMLTIFGVPHSQIYLLPAADSGMGIYTLTLTSAAQQPIMAGSSVVGDISEEAAWSITGDAGDSFKIALDAADGVIDPRVTVLDPAGRPFMTDENTGVGGNALIPMFTLPLAGTYTIVPDATPATGAYRLAVDAADPLPLRAGEPVTNRIELGAIYSFTGAAGQLVEIAMGSAMPGTLDTLVRVYSRAGILLGKDDDGGPDSDSLLSFVLPATGDFWVVPGVFGNYGTEGEYSLALNLPITVPLALAETRAVTLEGRIDNRAWLFEGVKGQVVTIGASSEDMNPVLGLLAPGGMSIGQSADSEENQVTIQAALPVTGVYIIRQTGLGSGHYQIKVDTSAMAQADANSLLASSLAQQAVELARQGEVIAATAMLTEAQGLGTVSWAWNEICKFGSLSGHGLEALPACDRAVQSDPSNISSRDMRAMAYALGGDLEAASAELRQAVELARQQGWSTSMEREGWLAQLEAGGNPFDAITQVRLWNQ